MFIADLLSLIYFFGCTLSQSTARQPLVLFTSHSGQPLDKANRQLNEQNNKRWNNNFPRQQEEEEAERPTQDLREGGEGPFLSGNGGAGVQSPSCEVDNLIDLCCVCVCVLTLCDNISWVCSDSLPSAPPSVPQVHLYTHICPFVACPLDSVPLRFYLLFISRRESLKVTVDEVRSSFTSHHSPWEHLKNMYYSGGSPTPSS